jgi:hypothetical protein
MHFAVKLILLNMTLGTTELDRNCEEKIDNPRTFWEITHKTLYYVSA